MPSSGAPSVSRCGLRGYSAAATQRRTGLLTHGSEGLSDEIVPQSSTVHHERSIT